MAIAVEGLEEKKSAANVCREYMVSQTLYYKWQDEFLEGGGKVLDHSASGEEAHRAEVEKSQKIIGKQSIQIEILGKMEELFGER